MRSLTLIGCAAVLVISTAASGQVGNPASTPPAVSGVAEPETVDPEAVSALRRMSNYLSTLNSFALTANSSLDVVTVHGQRLQMDAVVDYKVKKPGIRINYNSDMKSRQYFYDGKNFTIYSPNMKFYASAPAPATNQEFLKAVYDKFGISLPLEDLFRWNDGDDSDIQALTSGFSVGTATIDGIPTDHFAFRQGDFDWEVWIEQGARPLPRKLVIIDRTDPAMPAYTARLNWTLEPRLAEAEFTFAPDKDAKRIQLATFTTDGDTK